MVFFPARKYELVDKEERHPQDEISDQKLPFLRGTSPSTSGNGYRHRWLLFMNCIRIAHLNYAVHHCFLPRPPAIPAGLWKSVKDTAFYFSCPVQWKHFRLVSFTNAVIRGRRHQFWKHLICLSKRSNYIALSEPSLSRADPSPEVDAEWSELQEPGSIAITGEQVRRLGKIRMSRFAGQKIGNSAMMHTLVTLTSSIRQA
jgi:hypothetical protein